MASIPGPRDNDADDVALKLEVAQNQWARGDHAEALKWLRKAADAAFDADDDKRGIELSTMAAELSVQDKSAPKPKPKLPPPRDPSPPARPAAAPVRPSTPAPPIRTAPQAPTKPAAPAAEAQPSKRGADPKLSATGARRAAAARNVDVRGGPRSLGHVKPDNEPTAPASKRAAGRSTRKSSPDLEEESTREYIVADIVKSRAVDLTKTRSEVHVVSAPDEDWPTESVDNLEELESPPEHTEQPAASTARRGEARRRSAEPSRSDEIPHTQALRVAVGRSQDGRIVVRLLDANGLREGERDAMLVALTNDSLTGLFS